MKSIQRKPIDAVSTSFTERDSLYTIKEACAELKVCRKTLEKWIRSGELQATKFGTSRTSPVRITRGAIEMFIRNNTGAL